jgi:hypothetical protein
MPVGSIRHGSSALAAVEAGADVFGVAGGDGSAAAIRRAPFGRSEPNKRIRRMTVRSWKGDTIDHHRGHRVSTSRSRPHPRILVLIVAARAGRFAGPEPIG